MREASKRLDECRLFSREKQPLPDVDLPKENRGGEKDSLSTIIGRDVFRRRRRRLGRPLVASLEVIERGDDAVEVLRGAPETERLLEETELAASSGELGAVVG